MSYPFPCRLWAYHTVPDGIGGFGMAALVCLHYMFLLLVIIYEAFYDSKGKVGYLYTLMSAPKTDDLAYKASNAKKAKLVKYVDKFLAKSLFDAEGGLCIGKNISSASEVDGLYYFENGLAVWGCLSQTTHVSTFLSHENEIEL
ncbi:hypothetical protein CK203_046559 [Vitis vinifera]|uniref:Uncharacterized protein n=1 Tax=Vitis vinifera TaxID=29760 RepID=A0A438HLE4_VITVI|nr:hypothetical protein CK203_046559 [Vitis vinifera]